MIDEDTNDLAVQYALGILPRKQVPDFESQLRVDSELQNRVSELQQINEWNARESPQVAPPIDGYSGILERLAVGSVEPKASGSNLIPFLSWAGWGLAACFAAAFFVVRSPGPERPVVASVTSAGSSSIVLSELTSARPQMVSSSPSNEAPTIPSGSVELRVLELANLAEAFWSTRGDSGSGGNARTMLADARMGDRAPAERPSEGFTVFDRELKVGVIAVEDLPEMQPNRSYHIWAHRGDGGPPVWAGAIPVGESASGMFFFDLTDSAAELIRAQNLSFFVTEESSPSPKKPGGKIVLTGL